jgi:hypothetical protein
VPLRGAAPETWLIKERRMRKAHPLLSEAAAAGFLGGAAVALWFLVLDFIRGHPLQTPTVLGQLVLHPGRSLVPASPDLTAIVLYTVLHFAAFFLLALVAARLIQACEHESLARFALLMLFVAFEFFFYGAVNALSAEVGALFPLGAVAGANLLAAAVMARYFWRHHPALQRAFREAPLGV